MNTLTAQPGFRALVVDDDAVVRRMVAFALQQEGFHCDTASDGEQALLRLSEQSYDLLVTDLRMPNKHGHALAVDVLADHLHPIIIVHSSVDDPRLTKDLILRGVDDVVYKPTNYAAFAVKASAMVTRRRQQQAPPDAPTAGDLTADAPARGGQHSQATNHEAAADGRIDVAELQARLSDLSKVLPVSHAAMDVSQMVRSGDFDADQVATAVQHDPTLAKRVLQLANNQFYNATGQPITHIKEAVTRIGQKRVGEFALAMGAFASVTPETLPWMDIDLVWKRSVAAGIAVELLVKQGRHADISEGLLFSALLNASGRMVLGTHYPQRYQQMVAECRQTNESLLQHEARVLPQDHAEVMCDLLADWKIPAEVYEPLRHVLEDYAELAEAPEPMRSKVELLKLAVLVGQIAVGSWEPWDLVQLPPKHVLERLRIDDIGVIIEQTKSQLPGIAHFRSDTTEDPSDSAEPSAPPRQLAYSNLSEEPFDFLVEIVPSMKIQLILPTLKSGKLVGSALVNRIGVHPDRSTARLLDNCEAIVFVRDADEMPEADKVGTNVALPCSYAALRSACWEAAC